MGKVIVRADRAGLFYGEIKVRNGSEVTMANVRKLHYWDGAFAPEGIALNGVTKPDNCRFTGYIDEMEILGVVQIIPCTERAIKSIESVPVWKS